MPFSPLIQKLIEESITLHSQAIACTKTGTISHHEVLSRFKQNDVYHSPLEFVQWLEQHRLVGFLDRYVIAETLRYIAESGTTARYAVNLAAQTINQNGNFAKFLAVQQAIYDFAELPLIFEVTERESVQDTTLAKSVLGFIRAIGCPLAIDDFGSPTGSFNISSLDLLTPTFLKIDGWYTARLPDKRAIVDINALCKIAHCRGIQVILEQVEDKHIEAVRSQTDVDFIQGYAIEYPKNLS